MVRSVSRMDQFQKYYYIMRHARNKWCIWLKVGHANFKDKGRLYVQSFATKEEAEKEFKCLTEGGW